MFQARPKRVSNQIKFCSSVIKDLLSQTHLSYAWPFSEPGVSYHSTKINDNTLRL